MIIPPWAEDLGLDDSVLEVMGSPARYVPRQGDPVDLLADLRPAWRLTQPAPDGYGKVTTTTVAAFVAKRDVTDPRVGDALVILRGDGSDGTTYTVADHEDQQGTMLLLVLDADPEE